MFRVRGTVVELNEHDHFAWSCPRCFVWNRPDKGRCWNCRAEPLPEQWILDWSVPREVALLVEQMQAGSTRRSAS